MEVKHTEKEHNSLQALVFPAANTFDCKIVLRFYIVFVWRNKQIQEMG